MIDAIDVSKYQGDIDFDAVAQSGVKLVIVKATEGRSFIDPKFFENWQKLKDRPNLIRGAYAFARIDSDADDPLDAEVEAMDYCDTMKLAGGFLEGCTCPWLDVEWKGVTRDDEKNLAWVQRWREVVESELGRTNGIYTGRNVWRDMLDGSPYFTDLPLWQADINNPAGEPVSMGTDPAWPWSLHQYSWEGSVPGISGNVDMNKIRDQGTLDGLVSMRIVGATQPTPRAVDPRIDLDALDGSARVEVVATLQGLLMARGFGPDGLTQSNGLPDGKAGPKTRAAYDAFRARLGLPPTWVVGGGDWWELRASDSRR